MSALVRVRGLCLDHARSGGRTRTLHDIDLDIDEGESFGLIGASGAGKSTVALAMAKYLPKGAVLSARRFDIASTDLLTLRGEALRRFRRDRIGFVFQEPARALNPTSTIAAQVAETQLVQGAGRRDAMRTALASLEAVGLPDPSVLARRYPHELSGGQQQRVLIAMALAMRPRLLVMDEPTASLDAVARDELLSLISRLRVEQGFASLVISHDPQIVATLCDRVGVLEAGQLVETMGADRLVATTAVATSRTAAAGGSDRPSGEPPRLVVSRLSKRYGSHIALDDVDLTIGRGETLGVVGETASGKTTLGRAIAGLITHTGEVRVDAPVSPSPVQMVFQSPEASLNPRRTVRQTLRRSIQLLHGRTTPEDLLERTGLPRDVLDRLPHELSGGQKQRVAIARAFAGDASIIVCDEPTSALDATVRATILDLLIELQERTGMSYLFISHELSVVRRIAHRIAVMRHGRILETAPAATFDAEARHPYSRRLIAAAAGTRSHRTDAGGRGPIVGSPEQRPGCEAGEQRVGPPGPHPHAIERLGGTR